ncbi:MAG: polyamine aminopropyltransferase [Myxococcota bacterium]|nr:polyamine aminopropyltransferase [Myxococcota bacterium]
MKPTHLGNKQRVILGLIVLFLGGSGLVYEYCISTLATHLLGNSVEQFSLIIALMLFAMGIAGLTQRRLNGLSNIAEAFIIVELLLAMIGGSSAIALYIAFTWMEHFHVALYSLALIIGFGIGMEIPILLRINQLWRIKLADNVGDVLALDYVGALIGALVWAFLLLPVISLDRISLLLGLANLGAALVTYILLRKLIKRHALIIAIFTLTALVLGGLVWRGPTLIETARQHLYAYPIRFQTQSPYQSIVVTGLGQRLSLYLNGRLQFDSEDEFIYHELLVHPAMTHGQRTPKKVLVLGGGDGLAVREVLKYQTVRDVLLVDLDPAVTELASTYGPLVQLNKGALLDQRVRQSSAPVQPGQWKTIQKFAERRLQGLHRHQESIARVRTMNLDADKFLRESDGRWDVIIVDFPDPSSPDLSKLYSLEFYQMLRLRLRPDGIIAIQGGSPYGHRSSFWSISSTLEKAGFQTRALHAHVPTFGEWGWHLAAPAPIKQWRPLAPDLRYLSPAVMDAAQVFPATIARRVTDTHISTRLDPWVMRLYLKGENLEGAAFFEGRAER